MRDLFDFTPKRQIYAVFGNPIAHSQSPRIHRLFAKQCGIELEYHAIQVDLGGFEQAVSGFQANGGNGLNVTVPFKLNAWRLADQLTARAKTAESVNTLIFDDTVRGDNTDGVGLIKDIEVNLQQSFENRKVLILGAGGAVRGVLAPVLERNPELLVVANRTKSKAHALVEKFGGAGNVQSAGLDELDSNACDIIINATSTGLYGEHPAISPNVFQGVSFVYDMMYGNRPTAFMDWAAENRVERIFDGLGMLVEQAAESFRVWHGVMPETVQVTRMIRERLNSTKPHD